MGKRVVGIAAAIGFIFISQAKALEPTLPALLFNPRCFPAAATYRANRIAAGDVVNNCRSKCNRARCYTNVTPNCLDRDHLPACLENCDNASSANLDSIDTATLAVCNAAIAAGSPSGSPTPSPSPTGPLPAMGTYGSWNWGWITTNPLCTGIVTKLNADKSVCDTKQVTCNNSCNGGAGCLSDCLSIGQGCKDALDSAAFAQCSQVSLQNQQNIQDPYCAADPSLCDASGKHLGPATGTQ